MKVRLTTKLMLMYMLLLMSIVIGVGGYYVAGNLGRIREESISTTSQFADRIMEQVDLRLKSMDQMAVDLFSDPGFRQAAQQWADGTGEDVEQSIRQILNRLYASKSDIRRVVVYDCDGNYYSSGIADLDQETVRQRAALLMENYAGIFTQVNGKVFLSPQEDIWYSGGEEAQVISEIRPIKDSRTTQIVGFLEIQQNAMYLDSVSAIEINGVKPEIVVIMEETSSVFYSSNLREDFETRKADIIEMTQPYKKIIETDSTIMARASSNNFYCHTVVLLEKSTLRSYQFSMVSGSLYILLATALFSIAFGVFTTRALMRPIDQFVTRISQVDLDNLNEKIDIVPQSKEMQVLVGTFDEMLTRLNDSILRQKQHEDFQTRALFNALQREMGPHFLYNSLSSIADLCESGQNEKACDACFDLSDLLRYASNYEVPDVTLADELENVKCYMSLMQNRYRQRLVFRCETDEQALPAMMPRLTLQPLLENAIKYSIQEQDVVNLQLQTAYVDGLLMISVEDNGKSIEPERQVFIKNKIEEFCDRPPGESGENAVQLGGIGLIGTLTRLRIYYGQSFQYEIRANRMGGTTIILYMDRV